MASPTIYLLVALSKILSWEPFYYVIVDVFYIFAL